jgi:D-alanyl-D-alanine dipeptidase
MADADATDGDALSRLAPGRHSDGVFIRPAYHERGVPGALPDVWLRPEVVTRLAESAAHLRPQDLGLLVLDGWRPRALQGFLWKRYRDELEDDTELEGAALDERAREFVSPPGGPGPPPAHSTGAALDVTLCTADGEPLAMGGEFDELTDRSHPGYYERQGLTDEERTYRDRRRLLSGAMSSAGFWRLPTEWWHFEYGTPAWARHAGTEALYGEILPPSD